MCLFEKEEGLAPQGDTVLSRALYLPLPLKPLCSPTSMAKIKDQKALSRIYLFFSP